jgi:regulator of protease activity HflC (stomatin/prohibitin superfamily)
MKLTEGSRMKIGKFLIAAVAAMSIAACSRVEPGHVGIKVKNFGSQSGVSNTALPVGVYMTGLGTHIYEYPVYTNTYNFTADDKEGKEGTNESFSFQDRNGLSLNADVSLAYRVDPTKAPILFQKYRTDMDGIIAGPVRNALRNAIVEEASNMGVEEIYGPRKAELIARAHADVEKYFEPFGLHIEQTYWASNIRVPDTVLHQINAKIANEQEALAAQAAVATATAQADSKIATAKGKAEATRIEAEAIRTNPEILQQRAIETWDGKLPEIMTGNGSLPFINIDRK